MDELRTKLNAILDSGLQRPVLVEVLIDVVARSLGRLGGRPRKGEMTRLESDVPKPVTKPESELLLFSGSDSVSSLIPESSEPIEEISERDEPEPPGFLEFWALYPRKVGKKKARRAWRKAKPPMLKVRAALAWQRRDPWWLQGNAPHPERWINAGRWEDEPGTRSQLSDREARGAQAAADFVAGGSNGRR
jgi:hypothetical protein